MRGSPNVINSSLKISLLFKRRSWGHNISPVLPLVWLSTTTQETYPALQVSKTSKLVYTELDYEALNSSDWKGLKIVKFRKIGSGMNVHRLNIWGIFHTLRQSNRNFASRESCRHLWPCSRVWEQCGPVLPPADRLLRPGDRGHPAPLSPRHCQSDPGACRHIWFVSKPP